MTIPDYTPQALVDTPGAPVGTHGAVDVVGRLRRAALARPASLVRTNPRAVETLLDASAIACIVVAFTQTAISAEFIFHCVFVLLVLHAFLFGLRGTLLRIGLASIPLLIYAEAAFFGFQEPPLELTEWPLMFVIAALVALMAERRKSTAQRYAALFRRASERLLTVEEDERRRIAGELHDGVGQVLTALTLTLDAAGVENDPRLVRKRVDAARALAGNALAGTRDLSHRIQPARLEERGLAGAVRDLASQSGFPVRVRVENGAGDPGILGAMATVEVYRIIQEALANAARHSGAGRANVTIGRRDGHLTVVVTDGGCGFDPAELEESGIGLAGMHERARLLGARLSIATAPSTGTRVTISIPTAAR